MTVFPAESFDVAVIGAGHAGIEAALDVYKRQTQGCTEAAVPERKEQKGGQVNHAEVFRGYR